MVKQSESKIKGEHLGVLLSHKNPELQKLIEEELSEWVKSYEHKNPNNETGYISYDCYGGPGDIPDCIMINGEKYTPSQIFEHVKARDDIGLSILRIIAYYKNKDCMSKWVLSALVTRGGRHVKRYPERSFCAGSWHRKCA